MEDKKKNFYTYVDTLHKRNEEIYNEIQSKEKLRQNEQKKIEQMKDKMKQNEVIIMQLNHINKIKELEYLSFNRDVNIQKNKFENLKSLLKELPENIADEEKQYLNFKKEANEEIDGLLNSFKLSENSSISEETRKNIKETKNLTDELNQSIQKKYKTIMELKESYDKTENDFEKLLQLEKHQKKKLKKIASTLQFVENSSKEKNNQKKESDNDLLLKKKMEELFNDSYM